MLRLLIAAPIALLALPAAAETGRAHNPAQVSAALARGCTVQQVHTPAGKPVHAAALVHCADGQAVAANAERPVAGDAQEEAAN